MATERRQHRTPFTYQPYKTGYWSILSSEKHAIAVVSGDESVVRFMVRSCNKYDLLMKAANLCRAELEDYTLPLRTPGRKALAEIFELLKD